MADARAIATVAAIELIRREPPTAKLPIQTIHLPGPGMLTGGDVAAVWPDVPCRPIARGGDDHHGFEQKTNGRPLRIAASSAIRSTASWRKGHDGIVHMDRFLSA